MIDPGLPGLDSGAGALPARGGHTGLSLVPPSRLRLLALGGPGLRLLPRGSRLERLLLRLFGGHALLALLLPLFLRLDQLQVRGLAGVAEPAAEPDDAGVAAVPLRVPGSDGVEQLGRHRGPDDEARHVAPRREVATLGERDHALGEPAGLLGLGQG